MIAYIIILPLIYFLVKLTNFLVEYFNQLRVINKIKGPEYLPFIGNLHQIELTRERNLKRVFIFEFYTIYNSN